jgi:outer membrane protein TolC
MNIYISKKMVGSAALVVTLATVLAPVAIGAQVERRITRAEAISEARDRNWSARAARERARAAEEGRRALASGRWPSLRLEVGVVDSNDPVAVFGSRLRQARFTEQDFDPALLNRPDALTDWSGALAASWAPIDFGRDAQIAAAAQDATAARLGAEWAARASAFRGEVRFLQALAAAQSLGAADAAVASAEETLSVVERRRDQGLLTEVDVLQARASIESARARRIAAQQAVADARESLAVALGWESGIVPVPVGDLAPAIISSSQALSESRPDLSASAHALRGAEDRARAARRKRLPTLQGFARVESHAAEALSGSEGSWTVGVRMSVPLFTGFGVSARTRSAEAARAAGEAEHEQRLREARAEVAQAVRAVASARQGIEAATAAADAAAEAARLMRRRVEEGLTTPADLLAAEARASDLSARVVRARLALSVAAARAAFLTDVPTNDDRFGGTDR